MGYSSVEQQVFDMFLIATFVGAYCSLFLLWIGLRRSTLSMRTRVIVTTISVALLLNAAVWSEDRIMAFTFLFLLGLFAAGIKIGRTGWVGVQERILQCAGCGYDLSGQGWKARVCPECGAGADGTKLVLQKQRSRRRWRLFIGGLAMIVGAFTPLWLETAGINLLPSMPTWYLLMRDDDPSADATDELVRRIAAGRLSEERTTALAERAQREMEATGIAASWRQFGDDTLSASSTRRHFDTFEYWNRIGSAALASGMLSDEFQRQYVSSLVWARVRRDDEKILLILNTFVDRSVIDVTVTASAWACDSPLRIWMSGAGGASLWDPSTEYGYSVPATCDDDLVRLQWRVRIADPADEDAMMDWRFDDVLELPNAEVRIFEPQDDR